MSSKNCILSIITINKNNKKGLEKTLNSITNQLNKEFELIIVDGESIDGSTDLINSYKGEFKITKIIENDTGVFDAMNKGISIALNEFILFLNSGDYFINDSSSNSIIESRGKLKKLNYFNVKTIDSKNKYIDLNNSSWPVHQGVVMKTSILKKYLFDDNLKVLGDLDLWYRLKSHRLYNFKKFDSYIIEMKLDGIGSNPQSKHLRIKDKLYLIKKHKKLRDVLSIIKMCLA
ncbi:glycosyltransferase [Flavobacteriaceae bacterium]|nr:glycosyltransferase [Flavobacteriaceae bacterium]